MKMKPGDRTQLWRLNEEYQLEHEGSSPPSNPSKASSSKLVLDCEKYPQAAGYTFLTIAFPNPQRRYTQRWRFTNDGRLMCEHKNLCVQPKGGLAGLRAGERAVLGPIVTNFNSEDIDPLIEQIIEAKSFRPGSGTLLLEFFVDGPTNVIKISDEIEPSVTPLTKDPSWNCCSRKLERSNKSIFSNVEKMEVNNFLKVLISFFFLTIIYF